MSNNQTVCEAQTIDVLRKTCSSAVTVEYAPRTLLFPQGILADSVFFLISGLVKLTHIVSNGRELIVGLRRSGWLLGATAAILNQPQPTGGCDIGRPWLGEERNASLHVGGIHVSCHALINLHSCGIGMAILAIDARAD